MRLKPNEMLMSDGGVLLLIVDKDNPQLPKTREEFLSKQIQVLSRMAEDAAEEEVEQELLEVNQDSEVSPLLPTDWKPDSHKAISQLMTLETRSGQTGLDRFRKELPTMPQLEKVENPQGPTLDGVLSGILRAY